MIYLLGTHVDVQEKKSKEKHEITKNKSNVDFYVGVNFNFNTKLNL